MATPSPPEPDPARRRRAMVLLFAAGLSLRLLFAPLQGFPGDTVQFLRWMRATVDWGLTALYDPGRALDCNYPPTIPYLLRVVGELEHRAPVLRLYPKLETALVKLPMIALDLAVVALCVIWARRRFGPAASLWIAAALLANPGLIHLSAFWGQSDPAGFLPTLAALFCITLKAFPAAGGLLALAFWTKFQSVAFLPLAALMLWRLGRGAALARAGVSAALVSLVWISPFIAAGQPHLSRMFQSAYLENVGRYPDLSMHAANLWALHPDPSTQDFHLPRFFYGEDGMVHAGGLLAQLSFRRLGLLGFALALLAAMAWFLRGPGVARWNGAAFFSALAFFLFPTEMHERYLYPAIPLLALLAAGESRLRGPFWILSMLFWLGLASSAPPVGVYRHLAPLLIGALLLLTLAVVRGMPGKEAGACGGMPDLLGWSGARFGALAVLALLWPLALYAFWKAPSHAGVAYLDELPFAVERQDWRPPARAASIEHRPLQLGRWIYRRGVGVHAHSELWVEAPQRARAFAADLGLDAEVADDPRADIRFRVFEAETLLYESPLLTPESDPVRIEIPVRPGAQLRLIVDGGESINGDHANWANARFLLSEEPRNSARP